MGRTMRFAYHLPTSLLCILFVGLNPGCSEPKPKLNVNGFKPGGAQSAEAEPSLSPPPSLSTPPMMTNLPVQDVPARQIRDGARVMIGMNIETNEHGALSPNGQLLALAGGAGGVQLINVDTGKGVAWRQDLACIEPNPRYLGECNGLATFSSDGAHLWVFARTQHRLRRLAVPSLVTETELEAHDIFALQALDDGRVVGLRNQNSIVVDDGGKPQTFFEHQDVAVAVSPDGKQIAIVEDYVTRIHDVATRKQLSASPEKGYPSGVRLLPGGKGWVAGFTNRNGHLNVFTWREGDTSARLLAASADLDKTPAGDKVDSWLLPPPYTHVWVTMRKAGLQRIAVADGRSSTVSQCGAATGVVERANDIVLLGHTCTERIDRKTGARLPGVRLCIAAPSVLGFDGNHLLMQSAPGHSDRFDSQTGAFVAEHSTPLPFAKDATTLALISRDAALLQKVREAFKLPGVKSSGYTLSKDGRWLFVFDRWLDKDASIIDLTTMKTRTVQAPIHPSGDGSIVVVGPVPAQNKWSFDVRAVSDDKHLATITIDGDPSHVIVSDNGGLMAASDGPDKTVVVDLKTGRKRGEFDCGSAYHGQFEFSKDGAWLVCDTTSETRIIDIATNRILRRYAHPNSEGAHAITLSSDKRQLAVSAATLRIYDLKE
jgi:WD40 repeat protein